MKWARASSVPAETVSADRARRVSYLSLLRTRESFGAHNIAAKALRDQAAQRLGRGPTACRYGWDWSEAPIKK